MRRRLYENLTICGLVMAGACTAPAMSDIFNSLEDQFLHAEGSGEGDGAFMMDIDGDWAVLARPDRVDIYRLSGTRWVYHEQVSLPEDVGVIGDVDLSGELLAVSTPKQSLGDQSPEMDGAVHIYKRTATDDSESWSYHQRVDRGDEHGTKGRFGDLQAVALDGDTLMVGKPKESSKYRDTHVFELDGDGYFAKVQTIQDIGGERLDISGRWGVAVGAGLLRNAQDHWLSHKETANTPKGALDVQMGPTKNKGGFAVKNDLVWKQKSNGQWTQYAQLEDADGQPVNGPSRIDGECIIVGDSQWGDGTIGRALLFKRKANSNSWEHVETLNASAAESDSQYGSSVAIGGDWCLTAGNDDHVLAHRRGSKSNAPSMQLTELTDPSPAAYEEFGASVAISREWAVAGMPGTGFFESRSSWNTNNPGAIAVYKRNGLGETQGMWAVPDWSAGTEITPPNIILSRRLGTKVAISNPDEGSPIIVASAPPAVWENGWQGEGEVFVWTLQEDDTWSPTPELLLPDDPGEFGLSDKFGEAIAVFGSGDNGHAAWIAVSSVDKQIQPGPVKSGVIDIFAKSDEGFAHISQVSLPGQTEHLGRSLSLAARDGLLYLFATDDSGQGTFTWTSDDEGATWSFSTELSTDEALASSIIDAASNDGSSLGITVGDGLMSAKAISGHKGGRYWVATGDADGAEGYQVRLEERVLGSQAAMAHGYPSRDANVQGVEFVATSMLGQSIDIASADGTPRMIVGAPGEGATDGRVYVYEPWTLDLSGYRNPLDIINLIDLLEDPHHYDIDRYDLTDDHRITAEDLFLFMQEPEPVPSKKAGKATNKSKKKSRKSKRKKRRR